MSVSLAQYRGCSGCRQGRQGFRERGQQFIHLLALGADDLVNLLVARQMIVSRVGHGTAVHLSFPRIPAPAPSVAVPRPAPALGGMKVFLVDDDEDVRFLMTRMLTKAGVREVQVFAGGREVLARLPKEPLPDLVILDQNMPGLNGTQTLVRIRERYPALPILISSGQPDIEAWADFHQPRVSVISKPFTMEEIQAKLAQFARSPHPPEAPVG